MARDALIVWFGAFYFVTNGPNGPITTIFPNTSNDVGRAGTRYFAWRLVHSWSEGHEHLKVVTIMLPIIAGVSSWMLRAEQRFGVESRCSA